MSKADERVLSKADELKARKHKVDEESAKVDAELERFTKLDDREHGGMLASYNVSDGKVEIYGPYEKQQATLTEAGFRRLLKWGRELFGDE